MALYHQVASKLKYSSRRKNSLFAVDRIRHLGRNSRAYYRKSNQFAIVSEEVREAIEGKNPDSPPVVALESAIYTHGTYDLSD